MRSAFLEIPGLIGRRTHGATGETGRSAGFLFKALLGVFRRPVRVRLIAEHLRFVGNRSVGIIVLTSTFTGMVLTLQGYTALARFGSTAFLGPLVALSLIRELGPVLAALMIAARAGSAMAATIAGMRVSEQIDALEVMAVDPVRYLASTRLIATLIAVPMLTAFFDLAGIFAGYAFGVLVLKIDGGTFIESIREAVEMSDVASGFYKSIVFAVLIAWMACDQGYRAQHGAIGIGRATTNAVVLTAILVLAGDYALTALLF
ncbi:MAG: ABC transporter permease [Deltaproteobacteria bacterium]|nr:ABC transporter permease [Deltaproteobacteria bacterium]